MSWAWTSLALVALFFFLQALLRKRNTENKKLPPGPRGFPIFGSLHLLGKYSYRDFHKLAQKYGSIMFLRLGLMPTVVVSSAQEAELFMKKHDLDFASRPPLLALKHLAYGQKDLSFAQYGSYWRTVRKICTLELLSNIKINSFQPMRKEELDLLIEYIKEAASGRVAVDLSAKVASLSSNMTCRMVEFDQKGFKTVVQELMTLIGHPNLGDYIPQIASLDLQGLTKRLKAVAKVFDAFFEMIIEWHVQSKEGNRTKDFVDVMLSLMGSEETEYRIDRENIKAVMLDTLLAAMDTSSTTVEWTLSELMKHPRVMQKVQTELKMLWG